MRKWITIVQLMVLSMGSMVYGQESKVVELANVRMTLPGHWKKVELQGIDGNGEHYTTGVSQIFMEHGILTPEMDDAVSIYHTDDKKFYDSIGRSTENMIFSDTPALDENQGLYHKEFYYLEEINGVRYKIQRPKKSGQGITALFIKFDNGEKFTLYGRNLNEKDEKDLLAVFQTLELLE